MSKRDAADQRQDSKRTLTVEQAGRELGISRNLAYDAARSGEIPTIRIGRRLIVPRVAFDKMLEQAGEPEAVA